METYRWHESRKNLFKAEKSTLKEGLEGIFELSSLEEKNGRIVVSGRLEFDENKYQTLRIVFPTKYPAAPPKVLPIDNGNVKHFNKGNQYQDGAMCLMRTADWNSKTHNVGRVLKRSQKWLSSVHSEEGFSPDEIVDEATAPLKQVGQVLLPEDFNFPSYARTGKFVLTQFKPNYYILETNVLQDKTFGLQVGQEVFKWYKFDNGITFKNLFESSNGKKLFKILKNNFGEDFNQGAIPNIGLYLPDDPNPWHFFKTARNQRGVQLNYLLCRNIDRELYHRTKDLFDDQILKDKKVTVIGIGAIGSEVSRSLARNGVGNFDLIDKDTFEIGNSVRHAADLFYIGEPKVQVGKRLILRSNPNINVNCYHVNVLDDDGLLEKSLSSSDLCLVLTAEDSVDYMINDLYTPQFDIPFIFGRVSQGGVSGSIQVVKYQETPCLRCLANQNLDTLPKPDGEFELNELSPEYGSCSSPPLPGSEIDTKEIALQASRIALQELLSEEESTYPSSNGNQYYWHGPMGSKEMKPFKWEITNHELDAECNICSTQE